MAETASGRFRGMEVLRDILRPATRAVRSIIGTNGLSDRLAVLEDALLTQTRLNNTAPAAQATEAAQIGPQKEQTPPLNINLLLHQSRGAFLRAMPPGAQRLLSAGCAGLWYFEWIEQTYGRVPEHLGIEYYSPRPDGLPRNVTWIANTASDMSEVPDASCDLVFSGQNLEHLWPEDVAGFILEAARVLKPGGHLVMDSPNRHVTKLLNWSHSEHTIELTETEAQELVRLAGFDVTVTRGIWLCYDPRSGEVLPFDPNVPHPDWSVTERLIAAHDRPGDAFIWWVEAVRSERAPDAAAVHDLMSRLFRQHWPERVQRLLAAPGRDTTVDSEGEWVIAAPESQGAVLYGPYMPLRAGRYRVSWRLRLPERADGVIAVCEVVAREAAGPLARREIRFGDENPSLDFVLGEMTFGLEFRCLAVGAAGFSVLRGVELREWPDGPTMP